MLRPIFAPKKLCFFHKSPASKPQIIVSKLFKMVKQRSSKNLFLIPRIIYCSISGRRSAITRRIFMLMLRHGWSLICIYSIHPSNHPHKPTPESRISSCSRMRTRSNETSFCVNFKIFKDTKHFFKLTEAKKEDCTKEYAANEHSRFTRVWLQYTTLRADLRVLMPMTAVLSPRGIIVGVISMLFIVSNQEKVFQVLKISCCSLSLVICDGNQQVNCIISHLKTESSYH